MRQFKFIYALPLLFLFQSCLKSKFSEEREYMGNSPVYMSYDEFREPVKTDDAQDLVNPGKIYVHGNYIFINERFKGIHIYDNSNVRNPQKLSFISIPGNVDMAIKDNMLFADSYIDLLAIDITLPNRAKEVYRVEGAFPYSIPEADLDYPVAQIDLSKGVVKEFEVKLVKEKCENDECGTYYERNPANLFDARESSNPGAQSGFAGATPATNNNFSNRDAVSPTTGTGIAGSMARFMINDDRLYTIIDNDEMTIYNISSPATPSKTGNTNLGRDIETLFMHKDYLFVGAQMGMYIYDVSNPDNPQYLSEFEHAVSCDPVVAHDDYAFVTLRSGGPCGNFENQLNVVDIRDIRNPELVADYNMTEPFGLGYDKDKAMLAICDGPAGLKIYDASNEQEVGNNLIATVPMTDAYDVIPREELMFVIAKDGFHQYDYTDPKHVTHLSTIATD